MSPQSPSAESVVCPQGQFSCVYMPSYISITHDLVIVILKVPENEVSMSAERQKKETNRSFHLQTAQPPRHAAVTEPETLPSNNTQTQACTSNTFFLHQRTSFFPQNRGAVRNRRECLRSQTGGVGGGGEAELLFVAFRAHGGLNS